MCQSPLVEFLTPSGLFVRVNVRCTLIASAKVYVHSKPLGKDVSSPSEGIWFWSLAFVLYLGFWKTGDWGLPDILEV